METKKKYYKLIGFVELSHLNVGDCAVVNADLDGRRKGTLLKTSPIEKCHVVNGHIYIETKNSIYEN